MNNFLDSDDYIPKIGDTIDDYTILEKIGEGGKSHVYKVENRPLETNRVVKFLKKPKSVDHDRFITEARINANLNHPNIIHCYRFGYYKEQYPYMEMEFVDGFDLDYLITRNETLPAIVAASIALYICDALDILHNCKYTLYGEQREGIVHRDIKPANILISKDGEVKLADFGIAKPTKLSLHTTEMRIIGTIFYLSPEQLNMEDIDFASDIYSLGCVLYEMVTGIKTFKYKNVMAVVEAKRADKYDRNLLNKIPAELKNIIIKSLSPNKDTRYGSVKELKSVLEKFLLNKDVRNFRKTIFEFIKDPKTYISLQAIKRDKIKKKSLSTKIISITILFSILVISSSLIFVKYKKSEPIKKNTSTMHNSQKNITDTTTKPALINTTILAKSIKKITEPINTSSKKTYTKNMSDKDYLIYLKSLENSKQLNKLAQKITTRSVENDGYFFYLKGVINLHKNNPIKALSNFMNALTIPSFNKELRFLANYQIVKCKNVLYQKQPNSKNRDRLTKSTTQFLDNFSTKNSTPEYNYILRISK